ncbi:hypothetical protein, partial [Thermofilum sp.]|uniref:hypothetical protein n=1 Tax=Thermofilum sp. TaxID=1961369 RepID=UPI00259094D8
MVDALRNTTFSIASSYDVELDKIFPPLIEKFTEAINLISLQRKLIHSRGGRVDQGGGLEIHYPKRVPGF